MIAVEIMALKTSLPAFFGDQSGVSRSDGVLFVAPDSMTMHAEIHRGDDVRRRVMIMATAALMLPENCPEIEVLRVCKPMVGVTIIGHLMAVLAINRIHGFRDEGSPVIAEPQPVLKIRLNLLPNSPGS